MLPYESGYVSCTTLHCFRELATSELTSVLFPSFLLITGLLPTQWHLPLIRNRLEVRAIV